MSKARRSLLRALGALLCVLFLAASVPATSFADNDYLPPRTLRVGFFAFDGYHMMDENGVRSGYGYELLQRISAYANWTYEYVGYDRSWSDMLTMLENGEIDLVTSAQKTPERLELFDFSDEPIGYSSTIVTARAGDEDYLVGDYANWNGIRVGMIEGNSRNDSFAEFAQTNQFTYQPVFFQTTDEMLQALQSGGTIDVVVTSNLRTVRDEWVLAQFDTSPYYVIVKKGNTQLLDEINEALALLTDNEPDFRTELWDRYYSTDSGDEIAFTTEERAFIEDMQSTVFTAAINPDRAPLSWLEDGVPTGSICEIVNEIIRRTGLNIEIANIETASEYYAFVSSGGADIRLDAWYDYSNAEQNNCKLTESYLTVSVARLFLKSRKGTFTSAALVRGSNIALQYGAELASKYELVYYDTVDEVVNAVYSGAQDFAYLYDATAEKAVYDDVTNKLFMDRVYGSEMRFSIAISNSQNVLLLSVFNKAIDSLSEDIAETAVQRYATDYERPFTFVGYLYENPYIAASAVALLCLLLVMIVLAVHFYKKRKNEHIKMLDEQRKNDLLQNALSAAEQADVAKSQFLSRVSHEMRTPLNAIIGFLLLAQDKDSTLAEIRSYLGDSEIAAKQLLSIINDVLDMSAISAGKIRIADAPFDFKRLISSISKVYASQCKQKGLTFDTTLLTPIDERLIGDQLRLNQILTNLLGNAVKFTSAGGIRLSISQADAPGNKAFLRFEISDTGCGMDQDTLARLFHPFEQASADVALRYGGSGLGLSIVKNLVSMMGGAVDVVSELGKGSTFTVELPVQRSDMATPNGVHINAAHLRLLIADDEKQERDYMDTVLSRIGVRHVCVDSGEATLDEIRKAADLGDPYTVCIADMRMPGMDGIALTREIRKQFGPSPAVILATAYEHYQLDEDARQAGADMFVTKPLFQSTLFDLLMTITGGQLTGKEQQPIMYNISGHRVLLAEDNTMNCVIAVNLLKKCGVTCETVENGQLALDRFAASEPGYYQAILMDIQMPVMDGLTAAKSIRLCSHPEAHTIPIIALTANAFTEDIAKALSCGMNDHVAKPIEMNVLTNALGRAFTQYERSRIASSDT